jgi:hypothetical protein
LGSNGRVIGNTSRTYAAHISRRPWRSAEADAGCDVPVAKRYGSASEPVSAKLERSWGGIGALRRWLRPSGDNPGRGDVDEKK